jgi:hypothetical protein
LLSGKQIIQVKTIRELPRSTYASTYESSSSSDDDDEYYPDYEGEDLEDAEDDEDDDD